MAIIPLDRINGVGNIGQPSDYDLDLNVEVRPLMQYNDVSLTFSATCMGTCDHQTCNAGTCMGVTCLGTC